ncbi:MAG: hypothetical protein R3B45_11055 [Bdellovibrionota bacterium]
MFNKKLLILSIFFTNSCILGTDGEGNFTDNYPRDDQKYSFHKNTPTLTGGGGKKIKRYQNYFFAGSLDNSMLLYAKAAGVKLVIDLKQASKQTQTDQVECQALGITYLGHSVPMHYTLNDDTVAKFTAILPKEQNNNSVLIQHTTPDLPAALFAAYLASKSNLNLESTLAIARAIGLRSVSIEKQLIKYLTKT